jgi:hypothetical protein
MASDDPACGLKASTTVLKIITAAEHYQGYTGGYASPTLPHEYVFYVEYEGWTSPDRLRFGLKKA